MVKLSTAGIGQTDSALQRLRTRFLAESRGSHHYYGWRLPLADAQHVLVVRHGRADETIAVELRRAHRAETKINTWYVTPRDVYEKRLQPLPANLDVLVVDAVNAFFADPTDVLAMCWIRCYRCNQRLTDDESRRLGVGPTCRKSLF